MPKTNYKIGEKQAQKNIGPSFDATLDQVLAQNTQILDQVLTLQHISLFAFISCPVLSFFLSLSLSHTHFCLSNSFWVSLPLSISSLWFNRSLENLSKSQYGKPWSSSWQSHALGVKSSTPATGCSCNPLWPADVTDLQWGIHLACRSHLTFAREKVAHDRAPHLHDFADCLCALHHLFSSICTQMKSITGPLVIGVPEPSNQAAKLDESSLSDSIHALWCKQAHLQWPSVRLSGSLSPLGNRSCDRLPGLSPRLLRTCIMSMSTSRAWRMHIVRSSGTQCLLPCDQWAALACHETRLRQSTKLEETSHR